jgi:hypothetical protein
MQGVHGFVTGARSEGLGGRGGTARAAGGLREIASFSQRVTT